MRLRGINPTNTVFYSLEPRAEVYYLQLNFKISKLAYSKSKCDFSRFCRGRLGEASPN